MQLHSITVYKFPVTLLLLIKIRSIIQLTITFPRKLLTIHTSLHYALQSSVMLCHHKINNW